MPKNLTSLLTSIGHAQRAEDLKHGRPAYLATKPLLGGLREETPVAERKLVSMHAAHRPVKVVLTYQRYTKLQALTPTPGFIVLPPVECANADVFVAENVADIDSVRSQHLVWVPFDFNFAFPLVSIPFPFLFVQKHRGSLAEAVALLWCFGCGKVLASKSDMEAFMEKPDLKVESRMLHFKPAALDKNIGIQVQDELAKCFACFRLRFFQPFTCFFGLGLI